MIREEIERIFENNNIQECCLLCIEAQCRSYNINIENENTRQRVLNKLVNQSSNKSKDISCDKDRYSDCNCRGDFRLRNFIPFGKTNRCLHDI